MRDDRMIWKKQPEIAREWIDGDVQTCAGRPPEEISTQLAMKMRLMRGPTNGHRLIGAFRQHDCTKKCDTRRDFRPAGAAQGEIRSATRSRLKFWGGVFPLVFLHNLRRTIHVIR